MYDFKRRLRIGTRGSRLALTQTKIVTEKLQHAFPDLLIDVKVIDTSGDWKKEHGETRLPESKGGKGLFIKEVEEAILADYVDCGIHSLKDVPSVLDEGLRVDHMIERGDPRDAFICSGYGCYYSLPAGSVVGTASLRRQGAIKLLRPDLEVTILRGNVDTRLEKVRTGQVDAAILASIGLHRLDLEKNITKFFEPDEMLPPAGQGTIAIETQAKDDDVRFLFDQISDKETVLCCTAERAAVEALEGSCQTPIGSYAIIEDGALNLRLKIYEEDGSAAYEEQITQKADTPLSAYDLGFQLGKKLKPKTPKKLFA